MMTVALSLWGAVYTGSLARALWKKGERRAAVSVAILMLFVVAAPVVRLVVAAIIE